MKENNERDKEEKSKDKKEGIITRESIGAVGALFSALAFIILCTRSVIFGNIGIAVNALLLGLFGYFAYPLLLGLIYLSAAAFIGKRFIRNRKAASMIVAALVCILLIVHTAVTYSWDLSGYVTRCFKEAGAGAHGIDTCTPAGWFGGIVVYAFAALTTKIGAIVILSVLFLLFSYLALCFLTGGKVIRRPAKKQKTTANVQPTGTARSVPNGVPTSGQPAAPSAPYMYNNALAARNFGGMPASQAPGGPINRMNQPDGAPFAQPRFVQTPSEASYARPYSVPCAPEVRQRPGVTLPNDNPQTDRGQAPAGNAEGGFSPFGTYDISARNGTAPTPSNAAVPPVREPVYGEVPNKEFLFGGSAAENFRKNLIFDSNANVNKRPPADPNQPTVYDGSFSGSYSSAYADSVNGGEEPARPAKILTDNARGHDLYSSSYTLHESDSEPGFGNARGGGAEAPAASETVQPIRPVSPFPAEPVPPVQPVPPPAFRAEPTRTPSVRIPTEQPDAERFRLDEPSVSPAFGGEASASEADDIFSGRNPSALPEEKTPAPEPESPRSGFLDIFSASNPNIYGARDDDDLPSEREDRGRGFGDDFASRGASNVFGRAETPLEPRTDGADRLSPFGAEAETSEPADRASLNRMDIFDEETDEDNDLYNLRSDFADSRNDRLAEPEMPSSRTDDAAPPRTEISRGERGEPKDVFAADRRGETFEEKPRPVPPPAPKPRVRRPYKPVPLDYFDCRDVEPDANAEEVENNKNAILETLEAFKVNDATIASVTYGPTVTRYNVVIPRNISARKVVGLDQEIAMSLYASKGVNIYPNFEDGAVSIEVPNKNRQFVQLGCMLTGNDYVNAKSTSLVFAMGKDVGNRKVYGDICKMTHLLVAGGTGAGKSVFLGSLIISLIAKYSPEQLRLILIDPKKTEFVIYNELPHLMVNEIITDVNKAVQSLNWAIGEMNRRYGLFEQMSRAGTYVVNIDEYNANLPAGEEKLPKIVIIVDELADLMLAAKKEIEDRIQNLTQKARAAGIHLILATQRPSTDVITGVIKGNLPTRIAFMVSSDIDSRVILDASGAQKLLGKGDLLYTMAGINTPVRVQSAFISSEDSQKVVNYIKANNECNFDESVSAFINNTRSASGGEEADGEDESVEEVYIDALRFIIQSGSASISMIQRKCSVGYNKAGKIIEWMEDMGYISAFDGAKARKVIITKEEFEEKYGPL